MSLKHFNYTKDNNEVSTRVVYPLTILDPNSPDIKLQALDLTEMSEGERVEAEILLNAIHKKYLNDIYTAGFAKNFRSFFLRGIS